MSHRHIRPDDFRLRKKKELIIILSLLAHIRDLGEVNAYFASTEEGGWEDLSAAGCEHRLFFSFA